MCVYHMITLVSHDTLEKLVEFTLLSVLFLIYHLPIMFFSLLFQEY